MLIVNFSSPNNFSQKIKLATNIRLCFQVRVKPLSVAIIWITIDFEFPSKENNSWIDPLSFSPLQSPVRPTGRSSS